MESRGEIVRKVIKDSGLSITRIAEKIHISRNQLYLDFSNPEMSFDRILAIGQVLGYDFSMHFKELVNKPSSQPEDESVAMKKLLECQGKLISAMELLDRYRLKYGTEI
ncbi:helix-turn-helix domain-containing protein [Hymenobacter aranciens]|nr:hypothetical protein [Hymenobacter sp. ASUV-10]